MSQENVEVVRAIYEGINRVGPASLLALPDAVRRETFEQLFDSDFEIRQSSDLVLDTKGTFRGYEGFLASTRELVEAFSDIWCRWVVYLTLGEALEAAGLSE